MMKYPKATLVLCLCGVLLAFACNNERKESKETKETVEKGTEANVDQLAIRTLLEKYNDHFVKGEFEAMTAFIYPPVFEEFSKESMIGSMKASMHHEGMDITMKSVTIDSISPVYVAAGSGKYALATHRAKALYQFKPNVSEQDLRASCMNFTTVFGDENVECNIADKNFTITMSDLSFFIYTDSLQKWYTLGTSTPENLKKYIGVDILKEMGLREDIIGK